MSITWKIPRNCLAWLLLAQLFLIAPHVERLPLWVLGTYAVCAVWRIMVFQGRWSYPRKWIKILLALSCFAGIYKSYGSLIGLEATVALLFTGFSLKLLEVTTKRDVYVIIFLGYFVALTEFLFSQDFLITCLVFLSIVLTTTSLVALHQQRYDRLNIISLKKAGLLFAQALPLMVLLFVVFPRFGPLWNVPIPSSQATTGISDSISPGDVSNLSQSAELAFRVEFEDKNTPALNQLYWRALVLSEFDGRSWHQGGWRKGAINNATRRQLRRQMNNPVRYRVIQEPTHQPWVFALPLATTNDPNIDMTKDSRLLHRENIHSRIRYDVVSDFTVALEPELDPRTRYVETRLPDKGNVKAREFAARLYSQAGSDKAYVDSVLTYFRQQPFVYTLKPPTLGRDTIDEFLFSTRRGFCSHYASSFVYLMRSAGIAARMVAGYQGGEINPITGTVLVHQFDAHAWAEVWFDNEGWVRVDPTAAVAPERIEQGLQRAMADEQSFLSGQLLSPLRYRDVAWINQIRLRFDALSYYWQSAVLQYRGDRQMKVLHLLLGEVTPWRIASLLLGVGLLVVIVVALSLFRGRGEKRMSAPVRIYLRLCRRLQRAGFSRLPNEGAIDFARRVAQQNHPWNKHLLAATRAFVSLSYEPVDKEQKRALLRQLRKESLRVSYYLHTR